MRMRNCIQFGNIELLQKLMPIGGFGGESSCDDGRGLDIAKHRDIAEGSGPSEGLAPKFGGEHVGAAESWEAEVRRLRPSGPPRRLGVLGVHVSGPT